MKALLYTPSLPRFFAARVLGKRFPKGLLPLSLTQLPLPERQGFVRVRVRLSGVCGSDLALLYGKSPPSISPFFFVAIEARSGKRHLPLHQPRVEDVSQPVSKQIEREH